MKEYDIGIIGGGPGGYVAAIRASQNGKKVVLFEEKHLGGICLNWGCIPTKALLKSAEIYQYIKNAGQYGVTVENVKPDLASMVERSRKISKQLCQGIAGLLQKHKITVIEKRAKLESQNIIEADKVKYKVKNIIIAAGARARILKGFEPDGDRVWSYMEALVPKEIPKHLVIVGSGAIGIEFASFYNNLGSDVTVLDVAPRILPNEDEEISNMARQIFISKGMKFETDVSLDKLEKSKDNIVLKYRVGGKAKEIKANNLLMAVGIVGNTEKLGLENTKIEVERNQIKVNHFLQTAEDNIYAIGDIVDGPWLAHKASHEGIIASEHASNMNPHTISKTNIPACTYSDPQIASIGLTEEQARQDGIEINIGRFPFYGNGKALAIGKSEGLVKVIYAKKTGEILGAHMVGDNVTELISQFSIGKSSELTDIDFINTIFPHPTLSEMVHEASLDSKGQVIHK